MTIAGVSWLVVTFLINQYGVDVSAGNGVSIKIKDFLPAVHLRYGHFRIRHDRPNLGSGPLRPGKKVLLIRL